MDSIAPDILERLLRQPDLPVRGTASGQSFTARILVPEIGRAARTHYADLPDVERELAAMPFRHFGLSVRFDAPHRLPAFDADLHLAPDLRRAIDAVGVCIFSNAVLPVAPDKVFQKNIFPDLKFHTDRGGLFDNQVSLFYRNPKDPEHRPPRRTSTLIIPNAVFRMQAAREGLLEKAAARNLELFDPQSVRDAVGKVMVEMAWDGPDGTGEVCLFDNRTVVHASHHDGEKHYPIAVQYLT
jgi:hypothetical protein